MQKKKARFKKQRIPGQYYRLNQIRQFKRKSFKAKGDMIATAKKSTYFIYYE